MKGIYLAGKIAKNDWRHEVAPGLRDASGIQGMHIADEEPPNWSSYKVPVLDAWTLTGPYFSGCDHGCGHEGTHAVTGGCIMAATVGKRWNHGDVGTYRHWVHHQCEVAIAACDVFFAWLDDPTAYGTLVEIGIAKGRGKYVIVAVPHEWDMEPKKIANLDEMWFAEHTADRILSANSPMEALQALATKERRRSARTDSPIEKAFWAAHCDLDIYALRDMVTQHKVGKYRLDFAIPEHKIGIELDGYAYHNDHATFIKDRARQRALELEGWRIIRFAGKEVTDNAGACVRQAANAVFTLMGWSAPRSVL